MQILDVSANEKKTEISVKFAHNNKQGSFEYDLTEMEIADCVFEESYEEDIYAEIHEWVEKNIEFSTTIK